jgi:hypothetical protein
MHQARFPCYGTRVCSCSANATRRISRRNRRTRCATWCAHIRTHRSPPRLSASLRRRRREESLGRERPWISRSSMSVILCRSCWDIEMECCAQTLLMIPSTVTSLLASALMAKRCVDPRNNHSSQTRDDGSPALLRPMDQVAIDKLAGSAPSQVLNSSGAVLSRPSTTVKLQVESKKLMQ